jgi:hypothetical protein
MPKDTNRAILGQLVEEEVELGDHIEAVLPGICPLSPPLTLCRGRGFYPDAAFGRGRGRGQTSGDEIHSSEQTSAPPAAPSSGVEPVPESEKGPAPSTSTTEETAGAQSIHTADGGFRGRFRGRAVGYQGRGRFAGRAIRGRNKTWVRGPSIEDSLVTDR